MPRWTTEDELDYLKGIGAHANNTKPPTKQQQIQLLSNYLNAAHLRADWGDMDKSRVLSYARQRLLALKMQIS